MAHVILHLPSMLEQAAGGARSVELEARTLADALHQLRSAHPGLAGHLFDETGSFRPHVLCLHNGASTRWQDDPARVVLEDGDTLTILQAVSGG